MSSVVRLPSAGQAVQSKPDPAFAGPVTDACARYGRSGIGVCGELALNQRRAVGISHDNENANGSRLGWQP